MKSFRIRIIVWTSVISGLVMLAFGVGGILAYENAKRVQLDSKLERLVNRPFPFSFRPNSKERLNEEIRRELYSEFGSDIVFSIYGTPRADEEGSEGAGPLAVYLGDLSPLYTEKSEWPALIEALEPPERMSDGEPRFGGREWRGGSPRGGPGPIRRPIEIEQFSVEAAVGGEWRVAVSYHNGFNVLTAASLEGVSQDLALMRNRFAIAFPIALILLSGSIWIFATKAIRPVRRLTDAVESISAKNLSSRLETGEAYSEFSGLILHFNEMLERLERSFLQASRFGADAAHELKTPLSILQGQLELALQQAPEGSQQQKTLAGLLDETNRLKSITRKLLILAKADAGSLEIKLESFSLSRLLAEQVALMEEDNPEVSFECLGGDQAVEAYGDVTLTCQVIVNLLTNAIKYRHPDGAPIVAQAGFEGESAYVRVSNQCRSLSLEQRERLFDRFTRMDSSRNRVEDGLGLGLSLSLEFARAQRGELKLEAMESEQEIAFTLTLPCRVAGS